MAWYTQHHLWCRGRLVRVMSRYGCFMQATVVRGRSLDLRDGSRDLDRLLKLFYRSERIRGEIESVRQRVESIYS